jgi:hypothetical protein
MTSLYFGIWALYSAAVLLVVSAVLATIGVRNKKKQEQIKDQVMLEIINEKF